MAASATTLLDLVELVTSRAAGANGVQSHTLPSTETVLSSLQQRHKAELPWIHCGPSNLVTLNPLKPLESLSDANAVANEKAAFWDDSSRLHGVNGAHQPPHPYEFAGRIFGALQRSGKSQAIVTNGVSGSGKSYTANLVLSQLLRVSAAQAATSSSSAAVRRVTKLSEQIRASQVLLDAFGSAKTATTCNATRQGRILELHYSAEDSVTSILSGAKILTFGYDKSRLQGPLGKEERSFNVFYQFLAGASAKEQRQYELLDDASDYDLLASAGCYRLPAEVNQTDEMGFDELKAAFDTLGFKAKHTEMIYKILSAILLLGNVQFTESTEDVSNKQGSIAISPETRHAFTTVFTLLGLQEEDLEGALINKTTYIRKEVVCALLTHDGAIKQRDSLMSALYAILFSYIVESANHKLFPGDEAIKKWQRENGGNSIVILDLPGFQTKSPSGGLLGGTLGSGGGGSRRSTLIQAYSEDGYDQFLFNYSNELLQHWLTRRNFNDDTFDFVKSCTSDGIKLPEIDILDGSAMTLELLRGGLIGSRADTKPGGLLGGLSKTCSSLRKGKVTTEDAADMSFIEGLEERFSGHSRYMPRVAGVPTSFAIKHFAGTVSYNAKGFIEKDVDLFDSEFVRLFRTQSSESFLAKLFCGPSLAAESHPRDPSVLVAAQVSQQPLRRLSPLKVSRNSSTTVSSDPPEPDIQPVTNQLNDTLTGVLAALNEIPVWTISCIRPNDNALPGLLDIRRVKSQIEAADVASLIGRKRLEYTESYDFSAFAKRYASIGMTEEATSATISSFLEARALDRNRQFTIGQTSVWLSFDAWKQLEGSLRTLEVESLGSKRKQAQIADAQKALEANAGDDDNEKSGLSTLAPAQSRDTTMLEGDNDFKGAYYGESSDDLLKNAGAAGGIHSLSYNGGFAPPQPNFLRQSQMSFTPSMERGLQGGPSEVWGPGFKGYADGGNQPASPGFSNTVGKEAAAAVGKAGYSTGSSDKSS